MIPVAQTHLRAPEANCFAACMASILELPIEAMPNFGTDDWLEEWNDWLRPRSLMLLNWPHQEDGFRPRGYSILTVKPNGGPAHALVCRDGEVVHDPHPAGVGRDAPWRDWTVFVALDPTAVL